MDKVADRGNFNGQILVVGEAPGKQEVRQKMPFVGPSGHKLTAWMRKANIDLNNVYITNLCDVMPPGKGGNIDEALRLGKLERSYLEERASRVRDIVNGMPNLRVVVPVGNYAANALSPGGKVMWDKGKPGITQCRGSIYEFELSYVHAQRGPNGVWGNRVKVIPTIHPAAVMRQASWERRCITDWIRIGNEIDEEQIGAPYRNIKVATALDDIKQFGNELTTDDVLSFDIETWGNELKCIGFAKNETDALVVPTTEKYWGSLISTDIPLELVMRILEHPCDKVAQNGPFDVWWLRQYGIDVKGYHWDTLAMHHCLDALDNHSLDYLASVYTRQPYWKDEAKEAEEIVRVANAIGMDKLYVYNGLDATVTHEIFQKLYDLLYDEGLIKFYLRHYSDMVEPIVSMMLTGVCVDKDLMEKTRIELLDKARDQRDNASKIAGKPLWIFDKTQCERDMLEHYWEEGCESERNEDRFVHVLCEQYKMDVYTEQGKKAHKEETVRRKWQELQDKGISDTKLNEVLYDELGAPRISKTATGRIKADNVALKTLQLKVKERKRAPGDFELEEWKSKICDLVDTTLDHRRKRKLASFLDVNRVDVDDRLRCTYKFTTKSGRLASSKNPRGTGTNLQNIDRTLRYVFVPSPGRVILECDLSQAEGRVVKVLTGVPRMIEQARRLPTDGDEHTETAAKIFSTMLGRELKFEDVTKEQRYLGKRTVHASNYGMKGPRLSEILLKEDFVFTGKECQAMIDAHLGENPEIRAWQSKVRRTILKDKKLYTSWGRRVKFDDMFLDDELYRFGYSYVPQSEIGDLLNQYGLKPLHNFIKTNKLKSQIVLQVHDSVVLDAVPHEVYGIMEFLTGSLTQERNYGGVFGHDVPLSIPVEFSLGSNWAKGKEWKYLPERDEVDAYLRELVV